MTTFLGIRTILNGIDQVQDEVDIPEDWNVIDRVQFMCFDTSNIGIRAHYSIILEQKLNKDILSLTFRHYIMELIVEKVYNILMDTSSGQNILLFQTFYNSWKKIGKSKF